MLKLDVSPDFHDCFVFPAPGVRGNHLFLVSTQIIEAYHSMQASMFRVKHTYAEQRMSSIISQCQGLTLDSNFCLQRPYDVDVSYILHHMYSPLE